MKKAIWLVLALGALGGAGCSASAEGDIRLTWTILVNGAASTCEAVGAVTLEVRSTRGSGSPKIDLFDCDDYGGTTASLRTGTYTVEINLLDANDNPLNLVDVIETGVRVEEDTTTNIGNFPFGFTFGKATVQVRFGSGTTGNCTPTVPNQGAGVAVQEIRLRQVGAPSCQAFAISGIDGGAAATCERYLCQEAGTVQTLNNLPDGNYEIQVFGYKGATSANPALCYSSAIMNFSVTGGNTVNVGQITAPFNPDAANQAICNATKPTA